MAICSNAESCMPAIKIENIVDDLEFTEIQLSPSNNQPGFNAKESQEWSNENALYFIQLYKQEEILWNTRHRGHKDRVLVDNAWTRLAMAMKNKFSIKQLKAKKVALMSTYRKINNKVLSKKVDITSHDSVPDWFAYKALDQFLHGHGKIPFPEEGNSAEDAIDCDSISTSETTDTPTNQDFFLPLTNKRKKSGPNVREISNKMDFAFDALKNVYSKPAPDELSLYGELLVKKLRTLDECTRDIAMFEIDNLIFRLKHQKGS